MYLITNRNLILSNAIHETLSLIDTRSGTCIWIDPKDLNLLNITVQGRTTSLRCPTPVAARAKFEFLCESARQECITLDLTCDPPMRHVPTDQERALRFLMDFENMVNATVPQPFGPVLGASLGSPMSSTIGGEPSDAYTNHEDHRPVPHPGAG